MTISEVLALINHLKPDFLRGLDTSAMRATLKAAEIRHFPAGSVMLHQGYTANKLLLLLQGKARCTFVTENGQRLVLHWYPPGKVLGLAALLPIKCEYFINTEAAEDCWALLWEGASVRRLANSYPLLWQNSFLILAQGIGGFVASHASQANDTAPQRLARVLVNLADALGNRTPSGVELTIKNEDLADAANVTLFTTSRLLSEWQRNGLVIKTRGKVVLRSPEALLLAQEMISTATR
jgi:CRP-like cAMP-binding protein